MPLLFYRLVKALGTTGVRAIGGFWNVLLQTSKLIAMLILAVSMLNPHSHTQQSSIGCGMWQATVGKHAFLLCSHMVLPVWSQLVFLIISPKLKKMEAMGMCYFLIKWLIWPILAHPAILHAPVSCRDQFQKWVKLAWALQANLAPFLGHSKVFNPCLLLGLICFHVWR